ncbi:hypothetical protein [Echinimonas agarilytica]|uniref:Uncharacterized protein n=1 Tax=Echinimonas agarilytica TaxID=1215918 RepID=A0AA41W9B9_9GAMM|nr:hypothetical protein [Echinimonas agarilytica]MCM2680788.1 hypothetical protein [Echinimonas agarilytica]
MGYLIASIWLISHIICGLIVKYRRVQLNRWYEFAGVILGPLAIPLATWCGKPVQKPLRQ